MSRYDGTGRDLSRRLRRLFGFLDRKDVFPKHPNEFLELRLVGPLFHYVERDPADYILESRDLKAWQPSDSRYEEHHGKNACGLRKIKHPSEIHFLLENEA